MALSLAIEQRLERGGLVKFFAKHKADWEAAAKTAYEYVKGTFPKGAKIRPDDVAKALIPVFEVSDRLREELDTNRLTQKYWISDFADLVIDRTWSEISDDEQGEEDD